MLDNFFTVSEFGPEFLLQFLSFILICDVIFQVLDLVNRFMKK